MLNFFSSVLTRGRSKTVKEKRKRFRVNIHVSVDKEEPRDSLFKYVNHMTVKSLFVLSGNCEIKITETQI